MISIVIPVYNEEVRVVEGITAKLEYAKKGDFEIIVVDDGSTDNTKKIVQEQFPNVKLMGYEHNKGKGNAVKMGMLAAKGDLVLFTDLDLSTPMEELDKFLPYLKEFDIVIGSRAMKESKVEKHQDFYREFAGKTFNKIVRIFAVRGIKDTQCGFKLFTRKAAQDIFPRVTIEAWGFDIEALMIARLLGYKIKELPVKWVDDDRTKLNLVKASIRMFFDIFQVRWNTILGKYRNFK
ncbi:MAG: dolichyl-phosphate beta-glucosyltransferase [Candidatus Nanoarchaeia archaeon]